ncbi:hypothetical protein [Bacillus sp. AFS077874]|nr:hypothetical protein [Bacillus sp. AFS077874]
MKLSKKAVDQIAKELREHSLKYGFSILEKKAKKKKKVTSK